MTARLLTDAALAEIRARAAEFDAKMMEVNRVDVWPACEFDRSKLLAHIDALSAALKYAHSLILAATRTTP